MKFSGADNDQSLWGEAVMGEGEKPETRRAVASQLSKVSIYMVLRIKLVSELQMMLPSGCQTPNDVGSPSFSSSIPSDPVRFPTEQDCESTVPMSSLFYS